MADRLARRTREEEEGRGVYDSFLGTYLRGFAGTGPGRRRESKSLAFSCAVDGSMGLGWWAPTVAGADTGERGGVTRPRQLLVWGLLGRQRPQLWRSSSAAACSSSSEGVEGFTTPPLYLVALPLGGCWVYDSEADAGVVASSRALKPRPLVSGPGLRTGTMIGVYTRALSPNNSAWAA